MSVKTIRFLGEVTRFIGCIRGGRGGGRTLIGESYNLLLL
jgi:hypothetical protein